MTTPVVLDDSGSFSFPVPLAGTLAVTWPGMPGHHRMIFISVEDLAGNKATIEVGFRVP